MEVNQKVANFTLQTDEDKTVSLSDYAGKPVVLFFYPRADTPGCTIEACGFRDTFKKIQAAGAVVLGISRDTPKAQAKFKAKYDLPYTLLADVDEKVCNQFGVLKEKNMYGKKVWGIERTTYSDRPGPEAHPHLPQSDPRRPRGRGAGAHKGMAKIAQIKPSNAQKRLPGRLISRDFFEDSPEIVAPEAARQAAGRARPARAAAGRADCGSRGLSRAAQRSARSGGAHPSRTYAAEPGAVRAGGARVSLLHLRQVFLHEHQLRARGTGGRHFAAGAGARDRNRGDGKEPRAGRGGARRA